MQAKQMISLAVAMAVAFHFSGCAVVMALKQPNKKNVQVLNAGISRENVVTYLGAPITSENKDGKRVEIYQFVQGYTGAARAGRALGHLVLDVFSLFIWEVIGTPTELVLNGEKKTVKVTYDKDDRVEDVIYLKQE